MCKSGTGSALPAVLAYQYLSLTFLGAGAVGGVNGRPPTKHQEINTTIQQSK